MSGCPFLQEWDRTQLFSRPTDTKAKSHPEIISSRHPSRTHLLPIFRPLIVIHCTSTKAERERDIDIRGKMERCFHSESHSRRDVHRRSIRRRFLQVRPKSNLPIPSSFSRLIDVVILTPTYCVPVCQRNPTSMICHSPYNPIKIKDY